MVSLPFPSTVMMPVLMFLIWYRLPVFEAAAGRVTVNAEAELQRTV